MRKRIFSILLTLCMLLALLATVALAAETTVNLGNFSIIYEGTAPTYDSNTLTLGSGTYTISGSTTADKILVSSGATANITLNGVNIDATDTGCAFDMTGATVNLTLSDTNALTSGKGNAGLQVPKGAKLTITAASTGSLTAASVYNTAAEIGAGIGGGTGADIGTVTINGGTIIATGGYTSYGCSGAGIGCGGDCGTWGCAGGTVTITGGTVTATGSSYSAGIGGSGNENGWGGIGGVVNISGGTVIATGGDWGGAGIGGGGSGTTYANYSGSGAAVTITGGSVKATGGGNGTAIGAGGGNAVGTNNGSLKNNAGAPVTLYTFTLPGINSTAVTALTFTPALSYTYGTTDMKTSTEGKLYLYLPDGITAIYISTAAGTYVGNISGNAAAMTAVCAVSGTVNAGTTGASVSGLTVNLYASTDTDFATSVGSATTNGSGAYTINNVLNGSYVARVEGVADSYMASASDTITVSGSGVSDANITLSRSAYIGSDAPKPSLTSRTDTQVVLNPVTVAGQTVEYGKNTSNATPSEWQDGTTFNTLTANTTYYFFARVKQAGAVEAGGVSSALPVTTKNAAPTAPTLTFSSITADSVAITAVTCAEYSKDNGATWQDSNAFTFLSDAKQYTFAIRIKETADTAAGKITSQAQYTAAAAPSADAGYSVNYATEIITVNSGYEVNIDAGFAGTAVKNNGTLTPDTTYYIRVAANGAVPASAAVSFTIPARPAAPTVITAANITKTEKAITIANTVDGQEYQVNGTWYTPVNGTVAVTDLAAGTDYSIVTRVKATANLFASLSSAALIVKTKTVPAAAPAEPTIGTDGNKPTSNSITISTAAGNEYYISTSATADWSGTHNGYCKATVNGTYKFDSLNPATQYYIHVRVVETEKAMPSASAYVTQYTLPTTPETSVVTVNYAAETISFANTYEVSTSDDFTPTIDSNSALTPGTTYYVRVAAKSGVPASEAVSFTVVARPLAPTVITADKTKNSITVTPVTGQEYKIGSGAWHDSGSFTALSADTEYTVYARVKAVSSGSVSFASEAYSTTIKTKTDGSAGFALPTISVPPTYDPGKTLADISLPTGWTWSMPTTVPTVTNSGYSAVCAPTDTDTTDYSGVAGYAVDGSGKVTITCTVPLTVNCATPTAADFSYTEPASRDYSGTAKTAEIAVKDGILGMGAVTVRYYLDGVETVPTNSGTYTVKVDLVQGDNYAAATAITDSSWTFTIAKVAQVSLSITNKPAGVTYGDTFTPATTGGSGTGAVTWAVTSGSSATVNADTGAVTITGVGETTITATKAADGNYIDAVTDTYTFTPVKLLITVDAPSATGGWTKTYDGDTAFDTAAITVGSITNKVGSDDVSVSVQSAAYDTSAIGSGDKTLTISYAIDGMNIGNYSVPDNTVISTASITAATPTITLKKKKAAYTDKIIEIDAASVTGVAGGTTPDGVITYTYYTKDTCTDADKTSVDKSGAEAIGGAPKAADTYYVKANIAASGNYTDATSAAVKLTIYHPSGGDSSGVNSSSVDSSSGEDKSSAPVIVDGKTADIGTSEVKDSTTTVKVDQNKMSEQLKNAKDSVVIPIISKTDTASAQLVVQNVEDMAERSMTLTVKANDVSYVIPTGSVDTAEILKNLGASDSSKVPLNVTISKLSNNAVTVIDGTLMAAPVAFTITATYNGKNVEVNRFESYVQRIIEIPSDVDPKTITTAVVVETNGTQHHVPTEVYSEGGKWYAKINSMTNSTYALIQSNASFTDTTGKWYDAVVAEMASRKILSGIGENMFAGDRSITRAEFAAVLIRALGLPADGTSAFSDVSASAWYSGAVATAAQYSLVSGKGENRFDPNANITRQEAMLMLQRAAALTEFSGASGALDSFADADSVGSWAVDATKWSVGSGLIQGADGKLNPTANITRAESATIILRLLQKSGFVDVRS